VDGDGAWKVNDVVTDQRDVSLEASATQHSKSAVHKLGVGAAFRKKKLIPGL
jgi:hypothetical protein